MAKNKWFGTDGVRGVANEFPMTADFAFRLACALSGEICTIKKKVAIAKDTRISGDMLEAAMTAGFTASGIDVMTHALESYVSCMATDYTRGLSVEAGKLIYENLVKSYETGDATAREKVHHAATIAGMAFANAFLGVCHSMAHKLGAAFHIPHGFANALLINQVIRYNSNDCPAKQATFPQYRFPNTKAAYAEFARGIGLKGKTDDELVNNLIAAIEDMKKKLNIPLSIRDWGVKEEDWENAMKTLPELAFDDQCTAANPRYPLFKEIEQMYRYAYDGVIDFKL